MRKGGDETLTYMREEKEANQVMIDIEQRGSITQRANDGQSCVYVYGYVYVCVRISTYVQCA